VAVEHGSRACGATVLVVRHVVDESFVDTHEGITQDACNFLIGVKLEVFHTFFDSYRQSELNEVRGFTAVRAVAITDAEDVKRRSALDVRSKDEAVLVDLVLVSRLEADSCCKCELLDDVTRLVQCLAWLRLRLGPWVATVALLRRWQTTLSLARSKWLFLLGFFAQVSDNPGDWSFICSRWFGREVRRYNNLLSLIVADHLDLSLRLLLHRFR